MLLALAQMREQFAICKQQILQYRADELGSFARQAHMLRPPVRDAALPSDEPALLQSIDP